MPPPPPRCPWKNDLCPLRRLQCSIPRGSALLATTSFSGSPLPTPSSPSQGSPHQGVHRDKPSLGQVGPHGVCQLGHQPVPHRVWLLLGRGWIMGEWGRSGLCGPLGIGEARNWTGRREGGFVFPSLLPHPRAFARILLPPARNREETSSSSQQCPGT